MLPLDFQNRLKKLGAHPDEVEERFARSSGPGGQHVNKVSTAVTLHHIPSGISVTVQDSRSQAKNRDLARERLIEAMEVARKAVRLAEQSEREKVRRRNRPRPFGVQRRILQSKKMRGSIKKLRGRVDE